MRYHPHPSASMLLLLHDVVDNRQWLPGWLRTWAALPESLD
jgi:hypothetical protein